jgi:hypothetical protein
LEETLLTVCFQIAGLVVVKEKNLLRMFPHFHNATKKLFRRQLLMPTFAAVIGWSALGGPLKWEVR